MRALRLRVASAIGSKTAATNAAAVGASPPAAAAPATSSTHTEFGGALEGDCVLLLALCSVACRMGAGAGAGAGGAGAAHGEAGAAGDEGASELVASLLARIVGEWLGFLVVAACRLWQGPKGRHASLRANRAFGFLLHDDFCVIALVSACSLLVPARLLCRSCYPLLADLLLPPSHVPHPSRLPQRGGAAEAAAQGAPGPHAVAAAGTWVPRHSHYLSPTVCAFCIALRPLQHVCPKCPTRRSVSVQNAAVGDEATLTL